MPPLIFMELKISFLKSFFTATLSFHEVCAAEIMFPVLPSVRTSLCWNKDFNSTELVTSFNDLQMDCTWIFHYQDLYLHQAKAAHLHITVDKQYRGSNINDRLRPVIFTSGYFNIPCIWPDWPGKNRDVHPISVPSRAP